MGYFEDPVTHVLDFDDVHGAGAQRSNDKVDVASNPMANSENLGYGTFYYSGPQGDILRVDNMVRCVRDDTRVSQTITFDPLVDKLESDPDFAVSATASSGLTVSFSSSTTSVCTVSGDIITLLSTGTCMIGASQAGDSSYFTAPDVSQSFSVNPDSDGDGVGDTTDLDVDGDGLI